MSKETLVRQTRQTKNVKVTFNGEPVGYICVFIITYCPNEWPPEDLNEEVLGWSKQMDELNSQTIIHEFIEKGDPEYNNVNELIFKIKDGFLIYEARDGLRLVKMVMHPMSYITEIIVRRTELKEQDIHKLSKQEQRKAR